MTDEFYHWVLTMPWGRTHAVTVSHAHRGSRIEFSWLGPGRDRIAVMIKGGASTSFGFDEFVTAGPRWVEAELDNMNWDQGTGE